MAGKRRRFLVDFKAKVAIESIKERQTVAQLAGQYEVHADQMTRWTRQLLCAPDGVFSLRPSRRAVDIETGFEDRVAPAPGFGGVVKRLAYAHHLPGALERLGIIDDQTALAVAQDTRLRPLSLAWRLDVPVRGPRT